MAFKPTQPPGFDANSFVKHLSTLTPALQKQFIAWKQWVESSSVFDGVSKGGIRDITSANADDLNAVKKELNSFEANINPRVATLEAKVAALEAQPGVPFPGSG